MQDGQINELIEEKQNCQNVGNQNLDKLIFFIQVLNLPI